VRPGGDDNFDKPAINRAGIYRVSVAITSRLLRQAQYRLDIRLRYVALIHATPRVQRVYEDHRYLSSYRQDHT